MKKIIAATIFVMMLGCASTTNLIKDEVVGGTICKGSRSWQEANICSDKTSGLCIKVVEGPILLTEVKTNGSCPSDMFIGIKDTYADLNNPIRPRWELQADKMTSLQVRNIQINAGESLFVGTNSNDKVDSSCCYVSWEGYSR